MLRPGPYLVLAAALAACDPGSLYDGPVIGADGDIFVCEREVAVPGTGHHNPGMPCLTSGCHRQGTGPEYTVGGTLYDSNSGNFPFPGATIVVIDGDGNRFELPTAENGNFWSAEPMVFPLLLRASQCPLDESMISLSQSGDCNRGGCHGPTDERVSLSD
jgi:hypothetical protein